MLPLKKQFLGFIAVLTITAAQAQYTDTVLTAKTTTPVTITANKWDVVNEKSQFGYKNFIVPGILVAYGFASLETKGLKSINAEMKEEVWVEHPHKTTNIDDYLKFAPAVAVYGLNIAGIKGRNNFRDRSMIYVLSNLITNSTVFGLKALTNEHRPDGSDYYSFPSGHTAVAFASAEFMRQEYKDVSPWYGVAGYLMAGATGALRMYNNKHWLSDVMAGAGIGMASTKLAYWLYPSIKRKLFKDKPMNTMIMPYYQSGGGGIAMVYNFR